ncbi:MAG: phosphotransferase [Anaerolineae bacterium]
MEKRIRERYNQHILDEAMRRYDIAPGKIQELDGYESFMYEFEREGASFILRIGHSLRRSVPLIRGEVDWLNYLAQGGAGVHRAVNSRAGNLVELIDDGQGNHFLATAFVKARGRHMDAADATPKLFERWGALLGRMHALSKEYQPPNPAWKRPEWDDALMLEVERFVPPAQAQVLERFCDLMEHLEPLPRAAGSYGLIHQDAHAGNFFVDDQGAITLFDFDDCCYSWYMNDIAIVLFYAVTQGTDAAQFTREFMPHFLTGYRRENALDPHWLGEIPHFLKLREIDLYAVIHRSFDVDQIDNPWVKRYMSGRRERIENNTPYIDFDWESLTEYIR